MAGPAMHQPLSLQPTLSLVTRILLRVFMAMNCGAILLDETKRIIHLNRRARTCFGDTFAVKAGRLAALDRLSDAVLQSTLDDFLDASGRRQPSRDALALARRDKRASGPPGSCRASPRRDRPRTARP